MNLAQIDTNAIATIWDELQQRLGLRLSTARRNTTAWCN